MKGLDGARIREAIRAAEVGTTGRIGVRITDRRVPDALESARTHYRAAGLHAHPHANGVIFLVAPKSRKFAVYGGEAIDQRVGDAFWKTLVTEMTPFFAQGRPTEGLVAGITRVGDELRKHFPSQVHA